MSRERRSRHLVILNQATNYLTIGFANAFLERFDRVTLVTGSIHEQGELLDPAIDVVWITKWRERPASRKALSYGAALAEMWGLLMTRFLGDEVLFVSVPPMGYLLNLVLPHRFSMVIWDVYPDAFKITGMAESHPVYRVWSRLNRSSFKRAYRLFTIGDVMADLLSAYAERDRWAIHPIWSIFQSNERVPRGENLFLKEQQLSEETFIVQYSGNIGLTHNVELLVDVAARLKHRSDILFQIIGRGPKLLTIERLVAERGLANVQMLPFQSDEMFPHSLSAAHVGVVILDESVSRGSVPSKAYNLMSYGIPSLYVSAKDGQLAAYAETFGHAHCFQAGQLDEMATFVEDLADDKARWTSMSAAAEQAARSFRRDNADRFVDSYFAEEGEVRSGWRRRLGFASRSA